VLCWTDELRAHLAQEGHALDFQVSQKCFARQPARALAALVARSPAAVWVLFRAAEETQRWFAERKLACVVAGTCAPGMDLPSVDVDHRAMARHAAGLLRRKGHRRAALLLPNGAHAGDAATEAGFREGFASNRGDPGEALVLHHDGSVSGVVGCVDVALRSPRRATAFFVARTAHVLTVVSDVLGRGLRIPEDAAVISRDDDAFLEFVTPAVTRYVCAPESFARRLSQAAIRLASAGFAPVKPVRLMPRFVAGETV
jgi:DNA-binding LacI/PurR family transcriptional regulator